MPVFKKYPTPGRGLLLALPFFHLRNNFDEHSLAKSVEGLLTGSELENTPNSFKNKWRLRFDAILPP